ncbi:star-related lipid transfer protein 7 mitochondrial [Phtheirospermum japonicum]|uniref:Star-related lipid transfer protein 7 mitochondrial n=1 Tax=Phtheirospermum japonicum TaxID=374723 RepID=A0A830C236_9LAMI|nr:star-related lipid transfer protein 7 mitochondrial [Phtheirospermum japonicum]
MALVEAFMEILKSPSIWAMILGLIKFLGPVWIAFLVGVMVGWAWKPRWASLGNCKFDFSAPSSPSASISISISAARAEKSFGSIRNSDYCKIRAASLNSPLLDNGLGGKDPTVLPAVDDDAVCSPSELGKEGNVLVTFKDLEHLCHLVERKDGGPPWKHMMDRSTHNMSYQAWHRDPEGGPPQYCSRTVYEDATPELLRDFFWDDEFRMEWDDMILNASILEECPTTGTMVVHWTRKFPFFCSDREYIIGRRIWESGRSYYCVTKGVPCLSVPRRDKPRRVDLFYSSWYIQPVESRKGDGQLSTCEVILFHHEDMGIPREIAKFGIRQGMWGAVKTIERGFRAYQKHRASGAPVSHHALLAQINTKLEPNYLKILEGDDQESTETKLVAPVDEKPKGVNLPKLLVIGGALAVACSLDRGLLTKTLVFGVARRFGNMGRRAIPMPGNN